MKAGIGVQIPASQLFVTSFLRVFDPYKLGDEDTDDPDAGRGGSAKIMSHFTYILECSDKTYYVGCTNNLEKRLKQHNESKWGANYTKIRRPVILKYTQEFKTLLKARRREREIKGWRREKKEKLWEDTIRLRTLR